jgi:hypothetical protein
VETLRRAAEEAARARDPALEADVLAALGSALVHAVRGFDGARTARRPGVAAGILRALAFVDLPAGRHASAPPCRGRLAAGR